MSASAKITKNTALTTPKYTTTNEALLERLRIVETALAGEKSMSPSREEGKAKLQIKEWRAELLAEGGYNQIWLVSYTVKRQVCQSTLIQRVKLILP